MFWFIRKLCARLFLGMQQCVVCLEFCCYCEDASKQMETPDNSKFSFLLFRFCFICTKLIRFFFFCFFRWLADLFTFGITQLVSVTMSLKGTNKRRFFTVDNQMCIQYNNQQSSYHCILSCETDYYRPSRVVNMGELCAVYMSISSNFSNSVFHVIIN